MSEFNFLEDENGLPYLEFKNSGVPMRMDHENTTIYTHKTDSHIDHIFVEMAEEDEDERGRALGAFIFRQVLSDFDGLVHDLDERHYPHVHLPKPNPKDAEQYEVSGLQVEETEVIVIEEVDDEAIAVAAMANWDAEWKWFSES